MAEPILLYTNQWSNGDTFTGAYSKPIYKRCRMVNFYHTGSWIIDWTLGEARDEWRHSPGRMQTIWLEKRNLQSDIIGYDWEAKPYPEDGLKIEHAITDGPTRFHKEAAAFRYGNMVREMTPTGHRSLVYGLPPLWSRGNHSPWISSESRWRWKRGDAVWHMLEQVDIWAPVMYFRRWANDAQNANLAELVAFRNAFFPGKRIVPHVSPYDSSDGVIGMPRMSPEKFYHHQVKKCINAGADGCILWDMLHKSRPTEDADAGTEPYLDKMDEWA